MSVFSSVDRPALASAGPKGQSSTHTFRSPLTDNRKLPLRVQLPVVQGHFRPPVLSGRSFKSARKKSEASRWPEECVCVCVLSFTLELSASASPPAAAAAMEAITGGGVEEVGG